MMHQKDFVLQELGRLIGFWSALKEALENQGSYRAVDDLLIALTDKEFCKLVMKEWGRLTVKIAKSFEPQAILKNLRPIQEQLTSLEKSYDISQGMSYSNILKSLSWQTPALGQAVDFELWVPRREMTVGEVHRILMEQSFIAPATAMDLLSFTSQHAPNTWDSEDIKVNAVYVTASLLNKGENTVLAVYGPGSKLSSDSSAYLRPYITNQTAGTSISTTTAILVRRLAK